MHRCADFLPAEELHALAGDGCPRTRERAARTGHVRPFIEEDIPQVAELHRRVFRTGDQWSSEMQGAYRSYFQEVFLENPWYDEALPSLVYQENGGRVIGFLGVMPRPMMMNQRQIQAAIGSQLVLEPGRSFPAAAMQLVRTFLSGPQDLSVADEANNSGRTLWERAGGATMLLHSMYWTHPLRPSRFVMSHLAKGTLLAPFAWASRPFCGLVDMIAAGLPYSPFWRRVPAVSGEDLESETLRSCLSELTRGCALRPAYQEHSLRWLLDRLGRKSGSGAFQQVLVRSAGRGIVGWYLYYANRGGIGEVIQIGAKRASVRDVLDHLFYHAWQRGVVALSGRLDPTLMPGLSEKSCLFHHRGDWVLVHSRRPELVEAIRRGDAFLTRLEGEWCMRFK